jgi:hypothetical protein
VSCGVARFGLFAGSLAVMAVKRGDSLRIRGSMRQ